MTGAESTTLFGSPKDIPLAGCHFDNDLYSDRAVITKGAVLRVQHGINSQVSELKLKIRSSLIKHISCADINGDGIDELIVLNRLKKVSGKKAKSRLIVIDTSTGAILYNRRFNKVKDIFAVDTDGDGDAELGLSTNKRVIQFLDDESRKVSLKVRVGRYNELTRVNRSEPALLIKRGKKRLKLYWPISNYSESIKSPDGRKLVKTVNSGR